MLNRKIAFCLATVFAASLFVAPAGAKAAGTSELLNNVPDDAWGFFIAKSLDTIDEKAAMLKKELGLSYPDKVTDMALAALNLGDTLDRTAPFCVVMMDATKFESPDKAAVLLVGAKDTKELLAKFNAEEATDGISKCTIMGEPAFAGVKKNIVILGPSEDCVKNVMQTKKTLGAKLPKVRASSIDKSDMYLSISVGPILTAYKDMVMPMLQIAMSANDPEGKSAKALVKLFSEIGAFDMGFALNDTGFSMKWLVLPLKDSDLEKLIQDEKTTEDSMIGLLPDENYLGCMGAVANDSVHAEKFGAGGSLADTMKMFQFEGLNDESLKALDKEIKKLQKSITKYAVSASMLPDGSDGMFGFTLVAETTDAEAFVKGIRSAYETVWKVSEDEDIATIQKNITHKADAETIAGQKVDTIRVDLDGLAELGEGEESDLKDMHTLFGKECVLRFGAFDDKHVLLAFGGGKERYEKICENLKSKGKGLSGNAGIAEMSGSLPSPRNAEFFVAVDQIIKAISAGMKATGEEALPFEFPAVNAPVSFASTVEDDIIRIDLIVPMKLIKAGKEAYDKYAASASEENFDEEEEEGGEEADTADEAGGDAEGEEEPKDDSKDE